MCNRHVCSCVHLFVSKSLPGHNFTVSDRIAMKYGRIVCHIRCVACKNHDLGSKVKVTAKVFIPNPFWTIILLFMIGFG